MPTLYVATNGLSVWTSKDLGETLSRAPSSIGIYSGSQVWSLAPHPTKANEMLLGCGSGLFALDPATHALKRLPLPMDGKLLVTAIAISPHDPNIIIAGTQPSAMFRSDDGGKSWRDLETGMKPYMTTGFFAGEHAANPTTTGEYDVKHWTRVTGIQFDPKDPSRVYAGVEIDGAWLSTDGGKSFARANDGFQTADIHGYGAIATGGDNGGPTIFATTNEGLYRSGNGGNSWDIIPLESKWQYTRTIVARADNSGVMFVTNGNGPPGSSGKLFRSRDFGKSWDNVPLPVELESSLYFLAVHPSDPKLIFAAANLGQLFRSTDGGETWTALKRRLPEVRALAWLPD